MSSNTEEYVNIDEVGELIEAINLLPAEQLSDRLLQLDALLIKGEQVTCPIEHKFCDGMYLREVFVPSGTIFTTYTHKTEHPYFGQMGELLIWENQEEGWKQVSSPCTGVTKAGTKRIVYAITDVVWTTVHANPDNITDVEELENRLLEKYENPYLTKQELKAIQK